jgi:hypothetical protein
VDQLNKEIEEIRILMLEATKKSSSSRERWNKEEPSAVGQQHKGRGADRQLHVKFWDPGGSSFEQEQESHEKELMNFSSMGV